MDEPGPTEASQAGVPAPARRSSPLPILLAGPTAVGKSAIAMMLAERVGGEIISVDSMQVYRGLDIGTAKPTLEERQRVPHHLVDILDLTEAFDAAQFLARAGEAVRSIKGRDRVPILCGGTGLYFKAFLEGLSKVPRVDPALRSALDATPLPELLDELQRRDPESFARVDRQNRRRVRRAIEIIRMTGQPLSSLRGNHPGSGSAVEQSGGMKLLVFQRESADLHERIQQRVDEMFRRGLIEETEQLLKEGLGRNETAMQALGYRQVAEHLQGQRGLAETIELVKIRTRQFAKKQITWFRHQSEARWVLLRRDQDLESVVETLIEPAPQGSSTGN